MATTPIVPTSLALAGTPLEGKVALVTGASRGIGASIAKALARAGASVVLTYFSSPEAAASVVKEIETHGGKAVALRSDAADPSQVRQLVEDSVRAFGHVDILVNNAGVHATSNATETNPENLERMWRVNVHTPIALCREFAPILPVNGRIINIISVVGFTVYSPAIAEYGATKAALGAYTRALAQALGSRGITVNNVAPGPIETDMMTKSSTVEHARNATILKRLGKAEEVADLALFLALPTSGFITAATMQVSGGL